MNEDKERVEEVIVTVITNAGKEYPLDLSQRMVLNRELDLALSNGYSPAEALMFLADLGSKSLIGWDETPLMFKRKKE